MGFAASAGAFSALTAKGTPGMCSTSLQAGAVDFSPHPTLPTLAGEWEGAPHHSQPAVKGILKDKEEKKQQGTVGFLLQQQLHWVWGHCVFPELEETSLV